MSFLVRDLGPESIDVVHAMNEGALPHVNSVSREYFLDQVHNESYFRAVFRRGQPAAFLLAMNQDADYDSLNFLWFKRHYPRFVYIDRIVVGPGNRRAGLGNLLYRDLVAWAAGRTPLLACEVNLRPPNEASLLFHRNLGFEPVGSQDTDGGRKTVSLMVLPLDDEMAGPAT